MGKLYSSILLILSWYTGLGQVSFDQIPRNLQLFPRNAANQAEVAIRGTLQAGGYTKISMQVFRENILSSLVSQPIATTASATTFRLVTTILAEPAEYAFRVFLHTATDSSLIAERSRIVCGDVYIIYGQSNALALPDLGDLYGPSFDDKYMRTAAFAYGGTKDDIDWYAAKQPFGSVGGFGLTLQRLILQNYRMPTCILNGAEGGASIDALTTRDPINHANPVSFYGKLLYRAQWTGLAQSIKAIIWKQGEAEAGSDPSGYVNNFTKLYSQFREDYGNVRIYVGQINLLNTVQNGAAGLRDFQRRTKYLYPQVETIATVGTPGYGGVHYSGLANQQLAFEQYRQLARDYYGSTDTLQINSPDIKKAFYNQANDSITLVFDESMQMVWQADTTLYNARTGAKLVTRYQKDAFALDGNPWWVTGGKASGNRVVLSLSDRVQAKTIRYLPAFFSDSVSEFYDGPTLKNTRGMRAFSFDNVPIAQAIPAVTSLAAKAVSETQIDLSWTPAATAQTQLLERADDRSSGYKTIGTLGGSATSYSDTMVPDLFTTYSYRLRAYSRDSESSNSNVVTIRPLILGVDPSIPVVKIYPTPLTADRLIHFEADLLNFTDLVLRDGLGRLVKTWHGLARYKLSIDLGGLEAGVYIAELQTLDGRMFHRKVVIAN